LPLAAFILGFLSFVILNPYFSILTICICICALFHVYFKKENGRFYAWSGLTLALFPYFGLLIILLGLAYWITDKRLT
jgi:hypothetical protein